MGVVKGVKITSNNKVEFAVSVDYEESLLLRGHATNVHVFSEDSADIATTLVSRGKGNTKYIRIPQKIAKDLRGNSSIKCLRMDSKDKIIIYSVIQK